MSKIRVTFKHPDAVHYALLSLPQEEQEAAREVIERFVRWGELLTVEFDLETGTAMVVRQ